MEVHIVPPQSSGQAAAIQKCLAEFHARQAEHLVQQLSYPEQQTRELLRWAADQLREQAGEQPP